MKRQDMRLKDAVTKTFSLLALILGALVLLSFSSTALSQDNPVLRGLAVARQVVDAERGTPLSLVRWQYYEDNWANEASRQLYGAYGIDNCVAGIPFPQKRNILFGWTFSLLDGSGKEYQVRVSYDLAESALCDEVHVPPQFAPPPTPIPPPEAAPAPEAAAAPAPGPAPPSTANTGGFALGGHVLGFDAGVGNLMRHAGMTWVKKQVIHGQSDGAGIIAAAKGQGFKVLLGAKGNRNRATDPAYVAEFAAYVGFLASQGPDAIEVWNEPNIDREWPTGQVNGASYTALLAAGYQAIKAVNPNIIVISGAPAPTGFWGAAGCGANGCNDDVFMQQMAAAGAAQYMDCLGLHYNEGIVSPTQGGGDPRGGYPTYFFNSMLNRGAQYFPNTKVCWTELGYLSGEGFSTPIPAGFAWASNVTVGQQAQWLAQAAQQSRASGRVLMMIVWNVNFNVWDSDPQAGYAMLRPGGGCPACDSLGAVMRG
ncbi:MAG: hypothetical protein OXI77_12595 [Chloroflexota bacterium]|nr:hypothetical protein [Chloroflexota bacterium]MDE2909135.1 hypothetical protein [Chloroflexota bacterium]